MAANDSTLRTLAADRVFRAGLVVLLLLTAFYCAVVFAEWSRTPLGERPQGEAATWLALAQSMHDGTSVREPFFRSPVYLSALSLALNSGVPVARLDDFSRWLNGLAHMLATGLVAVIARRLWGRAWAGLLAGALWGFYPPAVFLAAEPGPDSLALLCWLTGVTSALATMRRAPSGLDSPPDLRRTLFYPFIAGIAFASAAALKAGLWPTALAWPFVALLLNRESRGLRLLASGIGVAGVVFLLACVQNIWGGAPQPLSGADLYRLSRALEITQPWAAPLSAVEFREELARPDALETEAMLTFPTATDQPATQLAIMDGFWWRRAVQEVLQWPARSIIRAARKFIQFFHYPDNGSGPVLSRALGELALLRFNPLGWTLLLAAGAVGLALGARTPGAWLVFALAVLAGLGAILWYPTMEARAPVAAILSALAGGVVARNWPRGWAGMAGLAFLALGLVVFTLLPRENDPRPPLLARDGLRRALALADLGHYDKALAELDAKDSKLSPAERELAAEWQFDRLLDDLPALPTRAELEKQLLENAEIATQSRAAQFRSGAYLWLLGRADGALYFWRGLADGDDEWGGAARLAVRNSGFETPEEAQRRAAWAIGGGAVVDPALAPLLDRLKRSPAEGNP